MINVIAGDDEFGHINQMISIRRHTRHDRGPSITRVLQTWLMAFVILLAGVTQSGLIPALLGAQATGIARASAADVFPGGDVLLICTPNGIKSVTVADGDVGHASAPDGIPSPAGHAFCSLCATHHGAAVAVELPDIVPVAVVHDVRFAAANGVATGHEWPRIRHSRAPPAVV